MGEYGNWNSTEKELIDELHRWAATLGIAGFFVTLVPERIGQKPVLDEVRQFVSRKLALIHSGCRGRKFIFHAEGWRLTVIFFPTDSVVSEQYALKNKVQFFRSRPSAAPSIPEKSL